MTRWILLIVLSISVYSCALEGSGIYGVEQREVDPFSEVEVEGYDMVLDLTLADEFSVKITGDDNLLDDIKVDVDDDCLKIEQKRWLSPDLPLVVYVETPALDKLVSSGDVKSYLREIEAEELLLKVRDDSEIEADGKIENLSLLAEDSGDLDAHRLVATEAHVRAWDSGDVRVCVKEELTINVSDNGDVYYYCDPQEVLAETEDSGDVHKR